MHFFRLAESTELNNAWIVGGVAASALIVLWLAVARSTQPAWPGGKRRRHRARMPRASS